MPDEFFTDVPGRIGFGGIGSTDPLTYAVYEPDRIVLGKRMEDHLRIGVCLWHSFAWDGRDMFGIGTLDRPWLDPRPTRCRPPARRWPSRSSSSRSSASRSTASTIATSRQRGPRSPNSGTTSTRSPTTRSGTRSEPARSCFGARPTCPRTPYQGGASTNPDPEVCLRRRPGQAHARGHERLGGTNYVLWGGREGYETLLDTDLKREGSQLARFLHLVAEHKHQIGFRARSSSSPSRWSRRSTNTTTTRRRSMASWSGRLEDEYRLNIEANHATLAGTRSTTRSPSRSADGFSAASTRTRRQERMDPRVPEFGRGLALLAVRVPPRRRLHV